jgi:hypothetical protein
MARDKVVVYLYVAALVHWLVVWGGLMAIWGWLN